MENDENKVELLKQIMMTDFMIVDFHLYLNTHPEDQEVLSRYNTLVGQSNSLKMAYEKHYGMLTQGSAESSYPWQWIKEPWPWEYSANLDLEKEDR